MIYDLIVVGSGAAGLMGAIRAARDNKKVLLLEQLPQIATKLKATGGGRCNLSNTLDNNSFMQSFGKNGRFMTAALNEMNHQDLMNFFKEIGVDTHIPDGFRIFPVTHNSSTIIEALEKELKKLQVEVVCNAKVEDIIFENEIITAVKTGSYVYETKNLLLATGGKGYPKLGATGDGFFLAQKLGHTITKLHPAMMPLHTKESWQNSCRADTIAKATIKVDLPIKKLKKISAKGDLIFTSNGLRGPVILDFAREITPYLDEYDEVPILINLTHGLNEDEIIKKLKNKHSENPHFNIVELVSFFVPKTVANELCKLYNIDTNTNYKNLKGESKNNLIKTLAWTPFTITGHDGFSKAMITHGGINLKEIDSNSMRSKIIKNLYFAGEVVNIDGPCGGYNLQWAFSSGNLAGQLLFNL